MGPGNAALVIHDSYDLYRLRKGLGDLPHQQALPEMRITGDRCSVQVDHAPAAPAETHGDQRGPGMISNDKKAVIHIAKAQVGMTDPEYRDLLGSVGAKSSKDLNNKTFDQVMVRFEAMGFQTTSKTRKKRKVNNLPKDKRAMMKKLEAIILSMDLTWAYVDAIARKRFGKDSAQWLEGEELFKLVQMMSVYQKRSAKRKRRA